MKKKTLFKLAKDHANQVWQLSGRLEDQQRQCRLLTTQIEDLYAQAQEERADGWLLMAMAFTGQLDPVKAIAQAEKRGFSATPRELAAMPRVKSYIEEWLSTAPKGKTKCQ